MTGFKKFVIAVIILCILVLSGYVAWFMVGAEYRNKIARTQISFLDGDYLVIYDTFQGRKEYEVHGKITTDERGYYYFWAATPKGKKYRQTPVINTAIEEL